GGRGDEGLPDRRAHRGNRAQLSVPAQAGAASRRGGPRWRGEETMTRSWQVDRRTVLKGLGATLALPFLEAMAPAQDAVKPPLRFGIWYYPQGSVPEHWVPTEVGEMTKLPSVLRPFEPVLKKTTVISNL